MMIDYQATLNKFFQEVIAFLQKRMTQAKDKVEHKQIVDTIEIVKKVAGNPKKYADYVARVQDKVEAQPDAFMPTPHDNTAFLIYNKVLWNMGDLYSEFSWKRENAQKAVLDALKAMKYKNATNVLKDFYFPFISPVRFAVKTEQKQK